MTAKEKLGVYSLLTVVLWAPLIVWAGFAVSILWRWFAVPLGAPAIGVLHAAGIDLLLTFIGASGSTARFLAAIDGRLTDEERAAKAGCGIAIGITSPAVALGIGWLIHWGMTR